jgi:hypothetical protein
MASPRELAEQGRGVIPRHVRVGAPFQATVPRRGRAFSGVAAARVVVDVGRRTCVMIARVRARGRLGRGGSRPSVTEVFTCRRPYLATTICNVRVAGVATTQDGMLGTRGVGSAARSVGSETSVIGSSTHSRKR